MLCVRIIFNNGFDAEECATYAKVAVANTLKEVDVILTAMSTLNITFANPASKVQHDSWLDCTWLWDLTVLTPYTIGQDYAGVFYSYYGGDTANPMEKYVNIDPKLANAIEELWKDEGVQSCFRRSSEYQLGDSAE